MTKRFDSFNSQSSQSSSSNSQQLNSQPAALDSVSAEQITPEQIAKNEAMLGGYAYQVIRQQSKQVFKLRSQVLSDTADLEPVHDMRVGTRRLRSALALFADVIKIDELDDSPDPGGHKKQTQLIKATGKLTKALGHVRDLDVMQQWLENISDSFSKKEKETAQTLMKTLKKRREKQFLRLEKKLKNKSYKKLTRHFKQWLKQPDFYPAAQQPAKSAAIEQLLVPIVELLQHPGWFVATHQQGDQTVPNEKITLSQLNQYLAQEGDLLHDLRKQIKGIRYQTEFFRALYDITYAAQIIEFRNLQNILGELQDQIVIGQFLTDEIAADWADQLPTIETAFQNSRLALWQQWQPYQQKYLKLQSDLYSKRSEAEQAA
jgi:CHAD domain-containing protein